MAPGAVAGADQPFDQDGAHEGGQAAGELGQQTGLDTTGAVTRMVDRLERAGYVRRAVDPATGAG